MSHKIAKAQRAALRNVATPNHMHTLIVESNRQQRRTNAHKLKVVKQPHKRSTKTRTMSGVRRAKEALRRFQDGSSVVFPVSGLAAAKWTTYSGLHLLERRVQPPIVERPIRALWRKLIGKAVPTPPSFVRENLRWSKADMDRRALEA